MDVPGIEEAAGVCAEAVCAETEQDKAINSNTPPEEKLQALNNVIQYFVESEEYEKCYNIKKIIDKIRC